MTASEILRSATPPPNDDLIEKAIADLDMRIWEWADALKNAHSQLRGAFAARPAASPTPVPPAATTPAQRPSASLYEIAPTTSSSLSAAAAAAHISSPPPMPAEWTAPPAAAGVTDWAAAAAATPGQGARWSTQGGHGASSGGSSGPSPTWSESPSSNSHGVQLSDAQSSGPGGVMSWPTAPGAGWPDASGTAAPSAGPQAWPTWTPTDASATTSASQAKKGAGGSASARPGKSAKGARPAVEGPSPEERAQKAAAEEALLAKLEDAIARRVRLLRRLDPDTPIEKLIDKARQGQADTTSAASAKDDKSSWWRRK